MACTDVARAKAKTTAVNLIIDFLPFKFAKTTPAK
jgi:hypothetical protein